MGFKEFFLREEKGNPHPTPQRQTMPGYKMRAVMPARYAPELVKITPKRKRIGSEVALIQKPNNIVSGIIKRPSDR